MSGASLHTGYGYWSAEGRPIVIEYFAPVLERIRAEAMEGFNRTGAGGFEIGGVLFGACQGDTVRILAHRPFACEYAMGPAFALSDRDADRFGESLAAPAVDPDLEGLEPVGWYHSHTRQGIYLSERDLELHNRFFPRRGIALVVRPDLFGSVRAGFFFREPDGSIRADSSYCEFDVAPPSRALGFDVPPPRAELPPLPRMPGLGLPVTDTTIERRGFPWAAVLLAVLVALAIAGGAFYYVMQPRPAMGLQVRDAGGPLRISWDRTSPAILGARSGVIEIDDGGNRVEMDFDPGRLRDGSVIYTPRSAAIDVRLRVIRGAGDTAEEYVRFVGPQPQAAATPPLVTPAVEPAASPEQRTGDAEAEAPQMPQPQMPQPEAEKAAAPAKETPVPERQEPKPVARFQPPPAAAPVSGAASLPPAPAVSSSGSRWAENAAPQVAGSVPAPPPPVLPPQQKPKPVYTGPTRGRLIWTGEVRSNLPITITGARASYGSISGELPGVPVRVQVHPADLTSRGLTVFTLDPTFRRADSSMEPAGPQNGWNSTVYTWNPKRARSVTVLEPPSAANNWKGLVLRGDVDWTPVIIIDWQLAQ